MNVRAEPSLVLEVAELPGELVTMALLGTVNTCMSDGLDFTVGSSNSEVSWILYRYITMYTNKKRITNIITK